MVLESLFNPFAVKRKPWEMFVAGVLYSLIGLFLAWPTIIKQSLSKR